LFRPTAHAKVHLPLAVTYHYEEHVAGRIYQIEVLPVAESRWRAQIVRLPGMPASMMPFYGSTPEQAAQELGRWLALVYNGVGSRNGQRSSATAPVTDAS
jgi:hypothetical protein